MIPDDWPRIAGIHVRDDGDVGCVWMAHDKDRDLVHLSGSKLVELVGRILNSDYVTKRVLPKQLLVSVTHAVDSGYLPWEGLSEVFRSKIVGNVADRTNPSG